MFQTDQASAASSIPTPASPGTQGYFTNGNPATGVAATIVDADWLNMVQQELVNVVLGGGIALSKTTYNQVLAAIKRLCQSTTVLADTGAANAYTATNAVPLVAGTSPTWVDGVVQAVKIAHTNTGASTYAPDGLPAIPIYGLGLQALQGNEMFAGGTAILMHATIAGVNSGNPICVLMECPGGAQQLAPGTASTHGQQVQQNTGIVGSVRNLKASLTAAATSLTITAEEIGIKGALGGQSQIWANATGTVTTSNTNAIGGVVGTALAANGFAAIYAAYNTSTFAFGYYAKNNNTAQPTVDTSLAGWIGTKVGSWALNASTQFVAGNQRDRHVSIATATALNASAGGGAITGLSLASFVPPDAVSVDGTITLGATSSGTANINVTAYESTAGVGAQPVIDSNISTNSTLGGSFRGLRLSAAQTMYYAPTSSGFPSYIIGITGYDF